MSPTLLHRRFCWKKELRYFECTRNVLPYYAWWHALCKNISIIVLFFSNIKTRSICALFMINDGSVLVANYYSWTTMFVYCLFVAFQILSWLSLLLYLKNRDICKIYGSLNYLGLCIYSKINQTQLGSWLFDGLSYNSSKKIVFSKKHTSKKLW